MSGVRKCSQVNFFKPWASLCPDANAGDGHATTFVLHFTSFATHLPAHTALTLSHHAIFVSLPSVSFANSKVGYEHH